ncbi:TPA: phosphoadenosine phosphosulfate reductase family protein [Photobacterium damselae]
MIDPNKDIVHVVNLSGGRTSAFLVYLMERARKEFGWNVVYIFCDTGVEHPQTYVFLRNIVKFWGIDLIILRAVVNPILGQGNSYQVFEPNDLMNSSVMPPFEPFLSMMKKYGTPTAFGPYCSERMKKDVSDAYCKDHFGTNYVKWLGIRSDEPKRLKYKAGIKYLHDLLIVDKQDILDWWKHQPFDLQLEEQEGNCLFCVKKSTAKLGLAIKQNPHLKAVWDYYLADKNIRIKDGFDKLVMYRGHLSLDGISNMYSDQSESDIRAKMRSAKRYESGACTESCEAFIERGQEINFEIVESKLYRQFEFELLDRKQQLEYFSFA